MQLDRIYTGNSLDVLRTLPDKSVNTCVTSPPYWGLRDYGVDGQLGLESTPEAYVEHMVNVFREVRRVLRDDGTLWLNIGDSYATNTHAGNKQFGNPDFNKNRPSRQQTKTATKHVPNGCKPKDLVGIPWMLAFALRADGWYLRSDIIWHKPNPMPESVRDRPTKAHEYIFLLSKSKKYYYDNEAIKEPIAESSIKRINQPSFNTQTGGDKDYGKTGVNANRSMRKTLENFKHKQDQLGKRTYTGFNERYFGAEQQEQQRGGRNKRTVWTVTTKPFKGAHFATFPPDLIEPCVLAGSPVGGVVLDPFSGAGTTALVAKRNGRHYVGIELNSEYVEISLSRLEAE